MARMSCRFAAAGRTGRSVSSFSATLDALQSDAAHGVYLGKSVPPAARKDVLLLHPPGACSQFTRSGSQYPPLGLNQLKAVIGDASSVDVLEADGLALSTGATLLQLRSQMVQPRHALQTLSHSLVVRACRTAQQGYLAHKKLPPIYDHRKVLGIGLLWGLERRQFLMIEVPLYSVAAPVRYGPATTLPRQDILGYLSSPQTRTMGHILRDAP